MLVKMSRYRTKWPTQFQLLREELASDLDDGHAPYVSTEHVGSTSIPGLAAKLIIDILIVVSAAVFNDANLARFKEALAWGRRQQGYHFSGDGGFAGRWTFYINDVELQRSVNVVAEGSMVLKSYITTRTVLKENAELRKEYEDVKRELAKTEYEQMRHYSVRKNQICRKILIQGGWTDEEVDARQTDVVGGFPRAMAADCY